MFGEREDERLFPGEVLIWGGGLAVSLVVVIGEPAVEAASFVELLELCLPEGDD